MQKRITLYRERDNFFNKVDVIFGSWYDTITVDTDSASDAMTAGLQAIKDHHAEVLSTEFEGIPVHYDDSRQVTTIDGNKMLAPNFDFKKFGLTYEQCQYVQRFADVHGITIQESLAAIFKYHKKCGELGMMMIDPPVNKYQEKLPI